MMCKTLLAVALTVSVGGCSKSDDAGEVKSPGPSANAGDETKAAPTTADESKPAPTTADDGKAAPTTVAADTSGSRARGRTFSVPVPAGYSVNKSPIIAKAAPGAVVLAAGKRILKGAFKGSIAITPVPATEGIAANNTPQLCKQQGSLMAHAVPGVKLDKPTEIVKTAVGPACQWRLAGSTEPDRRAIGTFMYKADDNAWVVTCNYDQRDPAAEPACEQVLQGFTFDL